MQNRCQLFLTLRLCVSRASQHIVLLVLLLGPVLGPGKSTLSALSAKIFDPALRSVLSAAFLPVLLGAFWALLPGVQVEASLEAFL